MVILASEARPESLFFVDSGQARMTKNVHITTIIRLFSQHIQPDLQDG